MQEKYVSCQSPINSVKGATTKCIFFQKIFLKGRDSKRNKMSFGMNISYFSKSYFTRNVIILMILQVVYFENT